MPTVSALENIMRTGGSVIVDATIPVVSLESVAKAGVGTGCTLTVKHANSLTATACESIAKCNPGHVIFDFTD